MQFRTIISTLTEWVITNTVTLVLAVLLLAVGWSFARLLSNRIKMRMTSDPNADDTVAPAVAQFARYAIYTGTLMLVLGLFGVPFTIMLTVLGAVGLAVAVGLRGILANISSGLMILALRPMSVGDYIEGAGFTGHVVEIELFNTVLKSSAGLYVFVPNSKIWGVVITNHSREPERRLDVQLGISYDADIQTARRVMLELTTGDARILADPAPIVHVTDLNERAVMIRLQVWTKTPDYWAARFDLTEAVKIAFDGAGIDMPHAPQFLPSLDQQKV